MMPTTVRTDLSLRGGLRLPQSADFPSGAKSGSTCFRGGVLYVRADVGGVQAWMPTNAPQAHYVHTQGAAAQVWEVSHGFTGDGVSVIAYGQDGNAIAATVANSGGMASVDVGSARTGYAVAFGLTFDEQGTATALLASHSASGDHDDRYYTQSKVNQSLSGKLGTTATAADSQKLAGKPASDYLTVNDRIDLGEL